MDAGIKSGNDEGERTRAIVWPRRSARVRS